MKHTTRATRNTAPSPLSFRDSEPSASETKTPTGIDVQWIVDQAAQAISARQNSIQQLRVLGDELRAALAQVETQHEVLVNGYNPPMGNSSLASSSSSSNVRR